MAQQKGLAFDVFTLSQFVQDASVRIQLTFFFLIFFFKPLFSEPLLCKGFTWIHTQTWGSIEEVQVTRQRLAKATK